MNQTELFPKTTLELRIEDQEATVKVLEDVVKARDKSVESAEEKACEARTDAYKARCVLEYLRHEFKLTAASTALEDDDGAGNGPLEPVTVDPLCIGPACGAFLGDEDGSNGVCNGVEDLNLAVPGQTPCPIVEKGGVRPDVIAVPAGNLLCVGADCEHYTRNDDCDFVDDECAYSDEPFEVKVGETVCPMAEATTSAPICGAESCAACEETTCTPGAEYAPASATEDTPEPAGHDWSTAQVAVDLPDGTTSFSEVGPLTRYGELIADHFPDADPAGYDIWSAVGAVLHSPHTVIPKDEWGHTFKILPAVAVRHQTMDADIDFGPPAADESGEAA